MVYSSNKSDSVLNRLKVMMSHYHYHQGEVQTDIPFLSLLQETEPTDVESGVLNPSICIVIQGDKKVVIGNKAINYGEGNYIASTIDIPIKGRVIKASKKDPYRAIRLSITPEEITSAFLELKITPPKKTELKEGAFVGKAEADVLLVLEKLLQIDSDLQAISFLAPAMKKEFIFHLLTGEGGDVFYNNFLLHLESAGISKAIEYVRENFDKKLKVSEIAAVGNMSVSTLHHKFKAVTTLSPIQYQKQLRLQEAKVILLSSEEDVTNVAFQVGYESVTQFNREYKRFFGLPPLKDIKVTQKKLNKGEYK
ncbi:AraC family transcriptional regulator [Halobacillus salinarum]|uniref:AraC family transcriptional regulator n=1 Tax=Halobacillus salinarum TaxID=2932257 RepID=A0ABY4EL61_9BACI|nr:AraC family transcriptional regulator [Halobacillus salinarum]UOQ44899.1 AraC family transcriptional regulator [Halobacillus salinarum]